MGFSGGWKNPIAQFRKFFENRQLNIDKARKICYNIYVKIREELPLSDKYKEVKNNERNTQNFRHLRGNL